MIITQDPLSERKESGQLWCYWSIDKYDEEATLAAADAAGIQRDFVKSGHLYTVSADPFARHEGEGNMLMHGGASNLWQCLIGNGTNTDDQTLTYFGNNDAALGVGDSSTQAAATQTDLQAATNKGRIGMDATYPTHTDGTSSGSATITYRSTFTGANYAWNEWGTFNSPDAGTGRMLNRKTFSGGTKSSGTWVFTTTLSLS